MVTVIEGTDFYKHNGKQNIAYCTVQCGYCNKRWVIRKCFVKVRKSCGCQNPRSAKHGQTQSRAYAVWSGMKTRCFKETDPGYPSYGGRGITVCDEWKDDFQAFWAYMGDPPKGMSIDRIDVNGNYEPGNVRWASRKTQQRNRRCNRWLVVDGERMTLAEATERFGSIGESGIAKRIEKYSMSDTDAVKAPPMRKTHMLTIYGKTMPMKDWCKISGVGYKIAWARIKNGWTHKEAIFGRLVA